MNTDADTRYPQAPRTSSVSEEYSGRDMFSPRTDTGKAKNYSSFVSMMKLVLPIVAVLLIVLVVIWPHIAVDDLRFRLGFSSLVTDQHEEPSMINPRYFGVDKDNQPFSVAADMAKNILDDTGNLDLEMPKADITLDDGTWLVLTAQTGIYQRLSQSLDLTGSVNLYHDNGYEFRTESASVDLKTGSALGDKPVTGQGTFGVIEGQGFRFIDKGKTVYFTGKSKLIMYPGAK